MATELEEKKRYVRAKDNDMQGKDGHLCHWPWCQEVVPPTLWGCKAHWYKLPKWLRGMIWKAYKPGQEANTNLVTDEYLKVAAKAQAWIKKHYPNG